MKKRGPGNHFRHFCTACGEGLRRTSARAGNITIYYQCSGCQEKYLFSNNELKPAATRDDKRVKCPDCGNPSVGKWLCRFKCGTFRYFDCKACAYRFKVKLEDGVISGIKAIKKRPTPINPTAGARVYIDGKFAFISK